MHSAGNDIVAFAAIDVARSRQPEFYSRIITPAEQELYSFSFNGQLPLEHFVWLVWSVKESAYKFLKRFDPGLVFSPSKMSVEASLYSADHIEGKVRFGDYLLYSRSLITEDHIYSVVNDEHDFSDVRSEIGRIDSTMPTDQSYAVRKLLLNKLEEIIPGVDLHISKNPGGWPAIMKGDEALPIPLSFTHHGNFVAYTLNLALWKAHAETL